MAGYRGVVICLLACLQYWILPVVASNYSIADGRGLAYAESCQAKLFAYRNASISWYTKQATRTSYYVGTIVQQSFAPGTTSIASLTTLCDGYPRVVGPTIRRDGSAANFTTFYYTNTNRYLPTTGYRQAAPCSIGPKDCELLYSSWTSKWSQVSASSGFVGLLTPPCDTTSTRTVSYSTNSAGEQCDNCQVAGSKARLLYWPVTTVSGSGDLCNKTGITISGTSTAAGPNTFVTDGVTITSPSVALSIAKLSRVDGCGTTIASTIIPVKPEEVSSVRGNRALFKHFPFNLADLNWHCADGEFFTDEGHHDCYQEVPADAYFEGTQEWVGLDAMNVDWRTQKNLTIWNDYHPQVVPPNTLSEAVHSIWGKDCNIQPDGVWDPPVALQRADTVKKPYLTLASPAESQETSTIVAAPVVYTAEYATRTADNAASTSQKATAVPDSYPDSSKSNSAPSVSGAPDNGGAGQGGTASGQVVVIHSVTYTRQAQSNGAEIFANAQTHFTVPKGSSLPVDVISQTTYTVSAASGGTSGNGTAYGSDGQQNSSYSSVGNATSSAISQYSAASELRAPLSILLATFGVFVVLAL